jgi:hypothetical protein
VTEERRACFGTPSFFELVLKNTAAWTLEARLFGAAMWHTKLRRQTMVSKIKLTLIAAISALGIASPAAAESPSYPWCIQGDTYRCWYMTREQCEEAVDNHGFCVTNPDVPGHSGDQFHG